MTLENQILVRESFAKIAPIAPQEGDTREQGRMLMFGHAFEDRAGAARDSRPTARELRSPARAL